LQAQNARGVKNIVKLRNLLNRAVQ